MEYMTDLTAAYVPLSLVPQPLKHSKPGQLRLKPSKSVAKLKGRSEATTINAELCIVNPELIATKRLLQVTSCAAGSLPSADAAVSGLQAILGAS